ncbi:hypothetical protein HPP92_011242 [Vanilla planifolia]|uniref:BHLH domain-containing protein n=1 Tax=Vanilla planifolia TaxID=51239 RepID=A0A835UY94_VANPL|nr:hypothetical protein HPP92_011242 [Vanilla planifolia]
MSNLTLPLINNTIMYPLHLPFPTSVLYKARISPLLCTVFSTCVSADTVRKMSSRRRRQITEDEINDLLCKLQSVLPEARRHSAARTSASNVLKETCSYIRSLHREVDDLSERLAGIMASVDANSPEAEIISGLLRS